MLSTLVLPVKEEEKTSWQVLYSVLWSYLMLAALNEPWLLWVFEKFCDHGQLTLHNEEQDFRAFPHSSGTCPMLKKPCGCETCNTVPPCLIFSHYSSSHPSLWCKLPSLIFTPTLLTIFHTLFLFLIKFFLKFFCSFVLLFIVVYGFRFSSRPFFLLLLFST